MSREAVNLWLPVPAEDMLAYLGVAFSKKYRTSAAWTRWITACTRRPIPGWEDAAWLCDTQNQRKAALVPLATGQTDKPVLTHERTGTLAVVPLEAAETMLLKRAVAKHETLSHND